MGSFLRLGPTTALRAPQTPPLRQLSICWQEPTFSLLQPKALPNGDADAWADTYVGGLGGWFYDRSRKLRWFHLELRREDIPDSWDWPDSMQQGICALELLAQQVLTQLGGQCGTRVTAHLGQFCDNMGVVGCLAKGLGIKFPIGAALICLSKTCLELGCTLEVSHIAGERNVDADLLSRLNCAASERPCGAKFPADHRVQISAAELLESGSSKCLEISAHAHWDAGAVVPPGSYSHVWLIGPHALQARKRSRAWVPHLSSNTHPFC